jgi:hypothetical protein
MITNKILTPDEVVCETNLRNARNLITKLEHPKPIIVVLIVVCVMILCYVMYVELIKINITGAYYDDGDNKVYMIDHNYFSNTIVISRKNSMIDDQVYGIVKGNAIILFDDNSNVGHGKNCAGRFFERNSAAAPNINIGNVGVFLTKCIKWSDNTTWNALV